MTNTGISLRLAACFAVLTGLIASVQAAAPMVKTQAPGFYRMMLGDFEVTALNDGVIDYATAQLLPDATAQQIRDGLSASALHDPVGMSYNAFLINTGDKLVLIDTGTGGKLDDSPFFHGAGRLLTNLRAAGYQPEQVDEVYITHRGQDHIGGLTLGAKPAFPNAIVRASKNEIDIFLDPEKSADVLAKSNNNQEVKAWLQFTQDLFRPYIQAGKFLTFDRDMELTPGIRSLATYGHTPGHTSYIVESKGQTLIVMGDIVLMGAIQFANPSLGKAFNVDPEAAVKQRLRIFNMATDKDYWVAGSHLSFPGIGNVRSWQKGYQWVPINYRINGFR